MVNYHEVVINTLISFVIIVCMIIVLAYTAYGEDLQKDIYDQWNTISEFEEVSSLRNFLIERDWIYTGVSINELDYILVLVNQCSNEFFSNVPTSLVLAVISLESSFRSDLLGFNEDTGLMQVIEKYHRERITKYIYDENVDLYDPRLNIMVGMDYLSELLDKFDGDIYTTLMAYNMGSDVARKYRSNGWGSGYADVVMDRMDDISTFLERRKWPCS